MKKELLVNWTSGDLNTSMNMVLLYVYHAKKKGWIDEITLLVWGASQQLLATNSEVQEQVRLIEESGVRVVACKSCADKNDIEPQLQACGVDVFYTGELLSEWLLSDRAFLSV